MAQCFPLTPIDVMLAAVMALKAYSVFHITLSAPLPNLKKVPRQVSNVKKNHTNLVKTPLIREDGDMSIISGRTTWLIVSANEALSRPSSNLPDMMEDREVHVVSVERPKRIRG